MDPIGELLARAARPAPAPVRPVGAEVLADVLHRLHTASSGRHTQVLLPGTVDLRLLEDATIPATTSERWEVRFTMPNESDDLLVARWLGERGAVVWTRHVPHPSTGLDVPGAATYHQLRSAGLDRLEAHRAARHSQRLQEPQRSTYLTLVTDGTGHARAAALAEIVEEP